MKKKDVFGNNPQRGIKVEFVNSLSGTFFLSLLLTHLIMISCDRSSSVGGNDRSTLPYYVDMENNIDNEKPLQLSLLGKEIEYVVLESSPECLLGGISSAWLNDSLIVVSSGSQVYLFSRSGKFIRKIGSNGRGPGEYTSARLSVDPFNYLIRVNSVRSMLTFDFMGNYQGSFDYTFPSAQGLVLDENRIMFHEFNIPDPDKTERYSWHILDMEGTEITSIRNTLPRYSSPVFIVPFNPLYMYDGSAHFKEYGVDTIYYFDKRVVMPYAIFNGGKYTMKPDFSVADETVANSENEKLWIIDILEDDDFLFIEQMKGFSNVVVLSVYNKQTDEYIVLPDGTFENDIDGGAGFWPEVIVNDNTLIDYIDAYELLQYLDSIEEAPQGVNKGKYKKLMELKGSIDENSNPVIMIVR